MLVITIHEGVFFGLPVEALEVVGNVSLALLTQHPLHVVGDARRDQAIRHRLTGRVHVLLGQTHAALAVHRGKVGFPRRCCGQPHVAGFADLRRHDVDVDRKEPTLLDRADDRVDHRRAVAIGRRHHGVLHHIGALLVGLLELECVQRGLVVIASPDVMHAALAFDQELVDIRGRPAHMRVGRTRVAFLVSAHADATSTGPTNIAGRERDIHQGAVGAVVVVAPDQTLFVGEHRSTTRIARLWLRDPFGGFANLVGRQAGDLRCIFQADLVGRLHLIEVGRRGIDEGFVDPALVRNVGRPRVEQREIRAGVDRQVHDIVFAGFDLAGIDRHGSTRIDNDDLGALDRLRSRTPPSSCPATFRAGSGPSGSRSSWSGSRERWFRPPRSCRQVRRLRSSC